MERVQFQQEQMLDELKDLVEKGLFTEKETKQILKKRTAYESALIRRVAKKADYLRYAAYEMGLEQLRRKRVERMNLPPGPSTLSDYALVRRQFHIFERAVKKFKSDLGIWTQYIEVAKREGARALVGRICARALQMHPSTPSLYILAAAHELDHHSPSAARTLLQRGIRMVPESLELWTEYVRMEMGFIESLRRRWSVLGIRLDGDEQGQQQSGGNKSKSKGKGQTQDAESEARRVDPSRAIMGDSMDDGEEDGDEDARVDAQYEGDEGAEARRKLMDGAIVKSVISSAARAVARLELFKLLREAIYNYPSPESLRMGVLDHLYEELRGTLPMDGNAVVFVASRGLVGGLTGRPFVEALKRANEEIIARVKTDTTMVDAYGRWIDGWCSSGIDENLKQYLQGTYQRFGDP